MRPKHARQQGGQRKIAEVQAYSSTEVYGKMALDPRVLFARLSLGGAPSARWVSATLCLPVNFEKMIRRSGTNK
jgi:hypothetical protein